MSKKFLSTFNPKKPKRYLYETVRQELRTDELGRYVTYGIRVSLDGRQLELVSDVTTDERAAQRLANLCTSEQLDPIHLNDVIEDLLVDLKTV